MGFKIGLFFLKVSQGCREGCLSNWTNEKGGGGLGESFKRMERKKRAEKNHIGKHQKGYQKRANTTR